MKNDHVITRQGKQYILYAGDDRYGFCRCACGNKTPIAKRNENRRGHRKGEPLPFIHGHNRRKLGKTFDEVDGCWIWRFSKTSEGYAQITIDGTNHLVHRLVYEQEQGPIPSGYDVHHTCEKRACINPAHLVSLTRSAHARVSSYAKLTPGKAAEIRESTESGVALAKRLGVSRQLITDVRKGRRWKEIA